MASTETKMRKGETGSGTGNDTKKMPATDEVIFKLINFY